MKHPNRLSQETSPYLRQHAHNPVDWYPWGDEAWEKAKSENKPVFLSIGYSACHWCHVMATESFENPEIAQILNANFVNIKIDREERPDLDRIYQKAGQLMGVPGGWPLSAFLTPAKLPFYVGTYFPPDDRYGRLGFGRVITILTALWQENPAKLQTIATQIGEGLKAPGKPRRVSAALPAEDPAKLVTEAITWLKRLYDSQYGGFGSAPKFPSTNILNLFLQQSQGQADLLPMVTHSLERMAAGGIYDQIGGGFHRYATDARWLIPHFEKMLYDNALLASLYLDAYQRTRVPHFREIVEETLTYILRDMTHPDGGFYASEDADSEGQEGKFYVFRPQEVNEILGTELGTLICAYYGITPQGNFEKGTTVLHRPDLPAAKDIPPAIIARGRQALLEARAKRERPHRDEKIITAWNGMMISALAKSGRVLAKPTYLGAAAKAANFILSQVSFPDGRLRRSFKDKPSEIPGFLEDYAYFTAGLIDLYQATLTYSWLAEAKRLLHLTIENFWSAQDSTFWATQAAEPPFTKLENAEDEAIPSGVSITAANLLRLRPLLPASDKILEQLLGRYQTEMATNPWGYATLLRVLALAHQGPTEVVLFGADPQPLLRVINKHYLPGLSLLGPPPPELKAAPPWQGRQAVGNQPTAYVCRNFTCAPPFTEPEALQQFLLTRDR